MIKHVIVAQYVNLYVKLKTNSSKLIFKLCKIQVIQMNLYFQ